MTDGRLRKRLNRAVPAMPDCFSAAMCEALAVMETEEQQEKALSPLPPLRPQRSPGMKGLRLRTFRYGFNSVPKP